MSCRYKGTTPNVIEEAFLEALQRDPKQKRQWVVVIDGQPNQRKIIEKIAKKHRVNITIVLDFIHVLEYLWKAAWCFFNPSLSVLKKYPLKSNLQRAILKG